MTDGRPTCRKCGRIATIKLRRQIMQSGGIQIFWYCVSCQKKANSKFISKQEANSILRPFGKTFEDLPIIDDYRNGGEPCEVCGKSGTQYHHWLPQAFMEQVENHSAWPGSYLCQEHHDLWHNIVTPYLPGFGNTKEAQYTKVTYLTPELTP